MRRNRFAFAFTLAFLLVAAPLFAEEDAGGPAAGKPSALVEISLDTSYLLRILGPMNAFVSVGFQGSVDGFGVDAAIGISNIQYPDYTNVTTVWALGGFAIFFSGGVDGLCFSARGGMIYGLGESSPGNGVAFDAHVGWNYFYRVFDMDLMVGVAAGLAIIVPGGGAGTVMPSLLCSTGFGL